MLLRIAFLLLVAAVSRGADFGALLKSEWEYTMEQSPTWASQLGDRRWNDRWPDVSLTAIESQQKHRLELLEKLRSISRDSLPPADRVWMLAEIGSTFAGGGPNGPARSQRAPVRSFVPTRPVSAHRHA